MPSRTPVTRLTGGCLALGVAGAALTALGLPASAAETDATAAASTRALASSTVLASSTPFISEIHYDNAGADTGEFIEVQLPAGTTSSGLSLVLYNGGNGATYDSDPLPAVSSSGDAPAVAVLDYPANGVQNGSPDGVALVRGSEMVEFLSYEEAFSATNGPAAGRTSTDIGVAEAGTEPAGQSLARTVATDGTLSWSGPAASTRGSVNVSAMPPTPPAAGKVVEIGAVQGTGAVTPLAGQQVTVTGVVVGDTPGLGGFYVQDRDGDGDPTTSDGVFVLSTAEVDLGDTVTVTGRAEEGFAQTQVVAPSGVTVVTKGSAADLPAPVALDLPADDATRERLEGMRVVPVDRLSVSEVYALTSYGELTLSEDGLLVQPTELARPGSVEAKQIAADNAARKLLLDDANSARTSNTNRPYLSPTTPVRVGDELTFTEPLVLGYGFSEWRLIPADGTAEGVFAPQNTRPTAPNAVGGDVKVGAFNVLNYFLTLGGQGRGATSQGEFEQQAGKIVPAISALGADVVTLMEIEDSDSTGLTPGNADTALADLVQRLNRAAGSQVWAYVPMPKELYSVDRDVIRSAIIYKQDVVQPVGAPVGLVDESVWSNAREPIAQTFVKDGDAFTVVANHFKSKGSGDAATGDNTDSGDGQGAWNGDRIRQAASLAAFTQQLRERSGDPDVIALGDFNAYTREDPIVALERAGFTDLGSRFDAGRYSYVFDELSGSLDHALASKELTAKVTDVTHWNINSVESFAYQYPGDEALYAPTPYRSSDHDPLVLGLNLDERCQGLVPTIRGSAGDDVISGTNGRDVIVGLGGKDRISGGNGDDVICGGAGDDVISGGNGDDVLVGGFGQDRVAGDNGADVLIGGPGSDTLDQGRGSGRQEQGGAES